MLIKPLIISLTLSVFVAYGSSVEEGLVPRPNRIEATDLGSFNFNSKTQWLVENDSLCPIVQNLTQKFNLLTGWQYKVIVANKVRANSVMFITNKMLAPEAYSLQVTRQNIHVEASTSTGFFYATQTLKQLLPPQFNGNRFFTGINWSVAAVNISDEPRFGYRGFMLDVSRYFMPKKDILRLLDYLALHKINYFHWHLVDDNGWRLEIKKYPRLTNIGAWRVERFHPFPMRANPEPGESTPVGGYYTQEEVREIVKYAQERFIEIIPEIEMPAHTNSSLAAYPQFACPVVERYIGVLPGIGGRNANIIYCAGNDSVFTFLEDVLTEVMALFPSQYIHIGGDEANKENWEKCPLCQSRMKENNITSEGELQSYFIKRINRFLLEKGKRMMGWDELVDNEIPEKAIIFGWRNSGSGGERAGEKGFNYIKSPAVKYYFIRYQGPQWFEPYTYFGNTTLRDVYSYEPVSKEYPASVTGRMLGIESCLWTEFVNTTSDAEYLIFPRLAAFAESAWTKPENKNWDDFISRLDKLLLSYDALGINYARSMFNIAHEVFPVDGSLEISLNTIRSDVEIRYTIDGSDPKSNSKLYNAPLRIKPATIIRAATFKKGVKQSAVLSLNTINHKAAGAKVITEDTSAFILTNGLLGSEKLTDGEWLDYYDRDGVVIIQLKEKTTFSKVELGLLNNSGMVIHYPSAVKISVADDTMSFKTVFEKQYPESERFQNGMFRTTHVYETGKQQASYIKIELKNPGITPVNHVRAGIPTRMAVDEVMLTD